LAHAVQSTDKGAVLFVLVDEYDQPMREILLEMLASETRPREDNVLGMEDRLKNAYPEYTGFFKACKTISSILPGTKTWLIGITPLALPLLSGFQPEVLTFEQNNERFTQLDCGYAGVGLALCQSILDNQFGTDSDCACAQNGQAFIPKCDCAFSFAKPFKVRKCVVSTKRQVRLQQYRTRQFLLIATPSGLVLLTTRLIISPTAPAPSRSIKQSATTVYMLSAAQRMAQEYFPRALTEIVRI
jgi:hypothetical protein